MPSILKLGNNIGSGGGDGFQDQYSVLLDGTDEYINIDDVQTALAATTVGTFSVWVKPVDATPTTNEVIIAFGDTSVASDLVLYITTAGKVSAFTRISNTVEWITATDNVVMSDATWTHIAVVQDAVSPIIYIDGIAVDQTFSGSTDKTVWFSDIPLLDNGRIGSRNYNNAGEDLHFNGNINDVLFLNDAASAAEVLNIYNNGKPKNERSITNGVSYFKIDGDVVNTCTDSIGSNNGTYVNVEQADIELDTP